MRSFYSNIQNLLPYKPKFSIQYLEQVVCYFDRKYLLVPAGKAASFVVIVVRLHYVNTLQNGTLQ